MNPHVLWTSCPFAAFALYASRRSTFTADHTQHQLIIERSLFTWTYRRRVYLAVEIERIVVVRTGKRGNALQLLLRSGRKENLTNAISDRSHLNARASALNQYLYTQERSRKRR